MADLNQAVAVLTTQMNNLINALQPILTGNVPAATATFAATPGTHNVTAIINYSTRNGTALYQEGSKSLYDDEEKFDLKNDKATAFVKKVQARAKKMGMGWDNATQGITTYQVNGQAVDLLKHYGRIKMSMIRDQSKPWYETTGALVAQRAAQNNAMLFKSLWNSLTEPAINQVQVYEDEYMLDDTTGNKIDNGPALYKVIMRCTTLDTLSTNTALRDKIKDLPNIAATLSGDVDGVHAYFFDAYNKLKACVSNVNDKEEILFAAYERIPDSKFHSYMSKKTEDYYDQTGDMAGKTFSYIIKKGKEKYDQLKGDTHYEWGTPSAEEAKVIALRAELNDVKSDNLQISKKLKAKLKDAKKGGGKSGDGGGSKQKNQKDKSNKKRQKKDEAWKKVGPKAGEAKTKEKDNKK
jgi:hypothetical protein